MTYKVITKEEYPPHQYFSDEAIKAIEAIHEYDMESPNIAGD